MKKLPKITLVTVAAAASIVIVILFNGSQMAAKAQQKAQRAAPQYPHIEVVDVSSEATQALVTGYGEAKSRFSLTLNAEINGRVEAIADTFEAGYQVKKGELLARIDDTDYQQALANAQATLENAKVAYMEEQRQQQQAQQEWQRSGLNGEPDSALVLREPQLKASLAELRKAENDMQQAQRNLARTSVTAPFDALVVSRDIQLGSYVQSTTAVATLYSTDRIEVTVNLSTEQWSKLPEPSSLKQAPWPVTLTDVASQQQWQGYVIRMQQHIDNSSRQRAAVVAVDQPLQQPTPLYPGTYVSVDISGKQINNAWQLPATAMSSDGTVWLVSSDNTLQKQQISKLYETDEHLYIAPIAGLERAQIVVRPLNSYNSGMRIVPEVL